VASEPEIYAFLQEIFADVFGRDDIVLTPTLTAKDVEGWDSYRQIEILIAAQDHFGVKLSTRELDNLHCIGDLVSAIAKKLEEKGK
jgi:acyl carrier protein